jgi:hypothetical protein
MKMALVWVQSYDAGHIGVEFRQKQVRLLIWLGSWSEFLIG